MAHRSSVPHATKKSIRLPPENVETGNCPNLQLRDYQPGEVSAIGEALYRRRFRAQLDTPENLGKLLMLDIESADFEVTDDLHEAEAIERLRHRRPDAVVYTLRIGYVAAEAVGGGLTRSAEEAAPDVP